MNADSHVIAIDHINTAQWRARCCCGWESGAVESEHHAKSVGMVHRLARKFAPVERER